MGVVICHYTLHNYYFVNRLYTINNANTAIASAKIKAKIMAMNILADAEGLRATDLTAEKPTKAITAAGPAVLRNMVMIRIKFCIV